MACKFGTGVLPLLRHSVTRPSSDANDSDTDMYALYKLRQRELEFLKIQVNSSWQPLALTF